LKKSKILSFSNIRPRRYFRGKTVGERKIFESKCFS
jgi:hypothetical protein